MITRKELITDLQERTRKIMQAAEEYSQLDDEDLQFKPSPESWSILECIEHLRYYSNFYLPEISRSMDKTGERQEATSFKSGWLGDYFAKMMLPGGQSKKISTFRSMNPNGKELGRDTLEKFISQQQETLRLLERAAGYDLTNTKAGISIAPWLKLRLGDIFRVVIYHNERHIVQATRVMVNMPVSRNYE